MCMHIMTFPHLFTHISRVKFILVIYIRVCLQPLTDLDRTKHCEPLIIFPAYQILSTSCIFTGSPINLNCPFSILASVNIPQLNHAPARNPPVVEQVEFITQCRQGSHTPRGTLRCISQRARIRWIWVGRKSFAQVDCCLQLSLAMSYQ